MAERGGERADVFESTMAAMLLCVKRGILKSIKAAWLSLHHDPTLLLKSVSKAFVLNQ